uniref:HAT C-terminal dimerisation domain-containing protein n=1 Tax=Latimeria chalumnae TaxID=7897 RepID=H3ASZ0_LATCH
NVRLQGMNRLTSEQFEQVSAFELKLQLFEMHLKAKDLSHFPACPAMFPDREVGSSKHAKHIQILQQEFSHRFEDCHTKRPLFQLFTNPFTVDVTSLPANFQTEVIDMQYSAAMKAVHRESGLMAFNKVIDQAEFPNLRDHALKMTALFGSGDICEQAFSMMNLTKSKLRSALTDEDLQSVMRLAMIELQPNIQGTASQKKCNISH